MREGGREVGWGSRAPTILNPHSSAEQLKQHLSAALPNSVKAEGGLQAVWCCIENLKH